VLTNILRNPLPSWTPLVFPVFLSDALEGHECLGIEVALWILSSVIGEEPVGELIRCRVERKER
jgi:hypothetical protein